MSLNGQKYHFRSVGLLTGLWSLKDFRIAKNNPHLELNWSVKAPGHKYMEFARSWLWTLGCADLA